MKVALALIFFACVAGSMAADARGEFVNQLAQQGQAVAQVVFNQLQAQILGLVQQAVGQLSALVGSIGGRFAFDFNVIVDQFKPVVAGLVNQALIQVLGSIQGLIGGMYLYPLLPSLDQHLTMSRRTFLD
jgi:phage-related protein